MRYTQEELAAIVRLSLYAQSFKDDMDEIRNVPAVYNGRVKVLCRELQGHMVRGFDKLVKRVNETNDNSAVCAQAWHSLDNVVKRISRMSLEEIILFDQKLKEYEQEKDYVEVLGRPEEGVEAEC